MLSKCYVLLLLLSAGTATFAQTKPKPATKPATAKTAAAKPATAKTQVAKVTEPKEEEIDETPVVAPAGKEVIAVYPFSTTKSYTYEYAINAGNAVEAGFVRSSRFVVVERSRFGQISEEDRFKEANTSEIVKKASRLGAKTVVTGQIVGVSHGDVVSDGKYTGQKYAEISISFKIIDVETAEIKMSEIIRGKGEDATEAGALQEAYQALDKLSRSYIGAYLPQKFKFMEVVTKLSKKKGDFLQKFKIWGGSDNGIKPMDVVELYTVSYLVNPDTQKKVEEKKLMGQARISEVNGASTSTCEMLDPVKAGTDLLALVQQHPENILIEYKGNWNETIKFWDLFKKH